MASEVGTDQYKDPELGYDPYETGTGMWEGGRVRIKDAHFGYKPDYNDGNSLLLFWECETTDEDRPEVTLQFSTGADWKAVDNGKRAKRDVMKPFNNSSHVGLVLKHAAEIGAVDELRKHGVPWDASMWIGGVWDLAPVEVDYKGEIGKKDKLVPVAFYGYGGGVNGDSKASAKPAAAPKATAAKKGGAKKSAGSVKQEEGTDNRVAREAFKVAINHEETYNDFVEYAEGSGDHAAFVEKVMGEYDVEGTLMDIVLDESDAGFYETHKEPF